MVVIKDTLEVDRLINLVSGFGWKITKQEFTEDRISISLEKSRAPSEESEAAVPG